MECGCIIVAAHGLDTLDTIEFCPKHAAADAMLAALTDIANKKNQYTKVWIRHIASKAIAKAEKGE